MSDWVHIDEPVAKPLTYLQRRIMELMQQGKSFGQICGILLIRSDHLRDEIFEIRKYEALMGKGKLTNEQRAAIYDAWKGGITQAELAKQYGVSEQAISQLCKKMGEGKAAAVNQAFEDAVNEMIAEAAQESEPEPVQIPAAVPDAVIRAVEDKITELQTMIRDNTERIESLKQHNKNFAERVVILESWLKEVQT